MYDALHAVVSPTLATPGGATVSLKALATLMAEIVLYAPEHLKTVARAHADGLYYQAMAEVLGDEDEPSIIIDSADTPKTFH